MLPLNEEVQASKQTWAKVIKLLEGPRKPSISPWDNLYMGTKGRKFQKRTFEDACKLFNTQELKLTNSNE